MKKLCAVCEGSGQISYFKGVSRFVVSWDECPECAGLGYIISDNDDGESEEENTEPRSRSMTKKGKGASE